MTPSQLRQWSFQNSQPDQWWISLDAVTEEIPVTVAEIEERMKSGDYSAVQALHVSQAGIENAPWVEVMMPPPMKAPPMMQPPLAVVAPAASPAFQPPASTATSERPKPDEILGIIILLIPLIGIFLIWYSPVNLLLPLSALTVASTAILVGVEANKLGIGKDKKFDKKGREKRESGPIGWAVLLLAFWIVGFPYYLYWRSRYGAKNMLVGGIGVALLFFGILVMVSKAVDEAPNKITQKYNEQLIANMEDIHEQSLSQKGNRIEELRQLVREAMEKSNIAGKGGFASDAANYAGIAADGYLEMNNVEESEEWRKIADNWSKIASRSE